MDLHELRNTLSRRHAELQNRLERVRRDGRHAGGLQQDWEEQAIELENDEVLAKLEGTIREELLQIGRTLGRLDNGRYGTCEKCGKAIPAKRLEALPYATSCATCGSGSDDR